MANKIEIKQAVDSVVAVTQPIAGQTIAEAVTTETVQASVSRPSRPSMSSSPSRGSMSSMFRLSKSFSRMSQVVAPDLMDDFSDDDDDDDTDDTDDTYDTDDDDPDEMQDGDEPLSTQEQKQIAGGKLTGASSNASLFGPSGSAASGRYKFGPEKIQPEDQQTTSRDANKNEPTKSQARSRSTTLEVPKAAPQVKTVADPGRPRSTSSGRAAVSTSNERTSISKAKATSALTAMTTDVLKSTPSVTSAAVANDEAAPTQVTNSSATKPRSASSPTKPSSPTPSNRFSTASTVRSSTISTENPVIPTPAKVDPLAPTAAAPYGYKIVTVKKPDGTITKVKRPLKEGEKAPAAAKPKTEATKTISQTSTQQRTRIGSIDASISPVVSGKAPLASVSEITETVATVTLKEVEGATPSQQSVSKASQTFSTVTVTEVEVPAITPAAEASTEKATKFPIVTEKPIDIQVTEKELERVTSPIAPFPAAMAAAEDEFKSARRLAQAFKIIVWSVGILLPLFFLALAIATALLNEKRIPRKYDYFANSSLISADSSVSSLKKVFDGSTNKQGLPVDPLSQAVKVAASAWPIIFAAVVAQTLKMYAALKVERGIKLMQLEQLISSHSVGSALKQPFMLRTVNWTTIALFFIWCLSPLAGQAILRMVTTAPHYELITTNITYFSSETLSNYSRNNGPWAYKGGYATDVPSSWFESALLSALLQGYSQTQYLAQDIYRNVRIPQYMDGSVNYEYATYSSLVGYPVWINETVGENGQRNNTDQETNFGIVTSYFNFTCSDFSVIDAYGSTMTGHKLFFNPNRTLTISAENNTKSQFTQLSWYPPIPPNSSNLLPNETSLVYPPTSLNNTVMPTTTALNGTSFTTPTSIANGTSVVTPTSVINGTSLETPTGLVNGTVTVSSASITPTAEANETSTDTSSSLTTSATAADATETEEATSTVESTSQTSSAGVLNATQVQAKAVQATPTSAGDVQMWYREPGNNGTLYYSTKKDSQNVYFSTCMYNTVVVNTSVYCSDVAESASCNAYSQERLTDREVDAMPLGYWFPTILQNLGSINPTPGNYSFLEQFVVDPEFGAHLNLTLNIPSKFDPVNVSGAELSARLGLVANTVWALGLNEGAFMGPDNNTWFNHTAINSTSAHATGEQYLIYKVDFVWLGVLIACSVILTVAAIAAAVWETRVVGPDFLGFANTAMKKNVRMPRHLNTMDARDRLLYLQNCEVILHDARPDRDIGRIALGVKDEESARLVAGRRYR